MEREIEAEDFFLLYFLFTEFAALATVRRNKNTFSLAEIPDVASEELSVYVSIEKI